MRPSSGADGKVEIPYKKEINQLLESNKGIIEQIVDFIISVLEKIGCPLSDEEKKGFQDWAKNPTIDGMEDLAQNMGDFVGRFNNQFPNNPMNTQSKGAASHGDAGANMNGAEQLANLLTIINAIVEQAQQQQQQQSGQDLAQQLGSLNALLTLIEPITKMVEQSMQQSQENSRSFSVSAASASPADTQVTAQQEGAVSNTPEGLSDSLKGALEGMDLSALNGCKMDTPAEQTSVSATQHASAEHVQDQHQQQDEGVKI